ARRLLDRGGDAIGAVARRRLQGDREQQPEQCGHDQSGQQQRDRDAEHRGHLRAPPDPAAKCSATSPPSGQRAEVAQGGSRRRSLGVMRRLGGHSTLISAMRARNRPGSSLSGGSSGMYSMTWSVSTGSSGSRRTSPSPANSPEERTSPGEPSSSTARSSSV